MEPGSKRAGTRLLVREGGGGRKQLRDLWNSHLANEAFLIHPSIHPSGCQFIGRPHIETEATVRAYSHDHHEFGMSPPARRAASLGLEGGRRSCGEPAQTQGKTSRLQRRLQVRDSNPLRSEKLKERQVKLSTAASWRVAFRRHSSEREPGSPTRSYGRIPQLAVPSKNSVWPFGKCQRFHFFRSWDTRLLVAGG